MIKKHKLSSIQKEQKIIAKIEKAKNKLANLKKKRILECGELVVKYGLDQMSSGRLEKALQRLSKELSDENQEKEQ